MDALVNCFVCKKSQLALATPTDQLGPDALFIYKWDQTSLTLEHHFYSKLVHSKGQVQHKFTKDNKNNQCDLYQQEQLPC